MININIGKKHLFVFCIVIGIVAGMLVAYAYNPVPDFSAANYHPELMGHSVDEINWGQAIMKNVGIGGGSDGRRLWVQNADLTGKMAAAFVNNNRRGIAIGALDGDTAFGSIQAAAFGTGPIGLLLNPEGGNVGIGTDNPTDTLDVNGDARITMQLDVGGNIYSSQIIHNSNDCREIFPSGGRITVPNECIDNECLIATNGFGSYVYYRQGEFTVDKGAPSELTETIWFNSNGVSGINGDGTVGAILLAGANPVINDDGAETNSNQWVTTVWSPASFYVCF